MKTILETINESIVLQEDTELLGVANGMVTVSGGVHLLMEGVIMGDLVVLEGASAEVNGTVMGYIINDGGSVKMQGMDDVLGKAAVLPPRRQRASRRAPSFWGLMNKG